MNILFNFYKPIIPTQGGVQRVNDVLAKELIERGHRVIFVAIGSSKSEDYHFMTCQYYIDRSLPVDLISYRFNEIITETRVNVIINDMIDEITANILSKVPKDIKIITVKHSRPFESVGSNMRGFLKNITPNTQVGIVFKYVSLLFPIIANRIYIKRYSREYLDILNVSDYLCFLTKRFIPRFMDFLPQVDQRKLTAINNPTPFSLDKVDYSCKEKLIIFVARIENESKNIIGFLRMWKIFSRHNKEWHAEVIGDGRDLEMAKRWATKEQLQQLTFEGQRTNVSEYYERASIVCVTSFYEGWSLVLVESMTYGCIPVSYHTFESVDDIIDDNENGLLIRSNTEFEMADRLISLIGSPEVMRKLSFNAHLKSMKFSPRSIAMQWEALIKSIKK